MNAEATSPDQPENETTADTPPRDNKRARTIFFGIIGVAVLAGAAWYGEHSLYGKYQQSTNDAYIQADSVIVSPKVSGYVEKVFVEDNQLVKAGQPLVEIDPRDYRAQTAQSEAQINIALASASGVQAQIQEQRSAIVQAQAQLAAAQADAEFAANEVARYQPLAQSGAETKERLSQLRNQAAQTRAKLASARAALSSAQDRIGTLQSQYKQAQAQGEAARAQLSAADTNLQSTVLRAAIDGKIGNKTVRQGQFVQAATRLMTLVPTGQLYITANFKETQLGLMRVGQPVKVSVDALPGVDLHGKVASFSPGTGAQFSILPPQNATGNFTKIVQRVPVRIAITPGPGTEKLLVPGMSVEVSVDTRAAKGEADTIRQEQEQHNQRAGK
ncbi:MAG: HlyD family secretion protein [Sphingobium sp.]|nr:HlyD family secretion protein [Sphingobium sp.]